MMLARFAPSALVAATMLLAGCARGENANTDTVAPAADTSSGMASMAGHDMNRPPAKDAEHEFLRMMADHHEGLIEMATAAMTKASQTATQGDAHNLHTKQADELKKMVAMVQSQYGETVTPMAMPNHKAMNDALATKTGADYDRTFYRNVIQHHREALKMIDDVMPRLTKADVKRMAETMRADQAKEITAFERKAGV